MEPVQLTIVVVLLTLTAVIVILSTQVWGILKEFKQSIVKVNKMLDDTGKITGTVSEGVEGFSGVIGSIRSVAGIVSAFKRKGDTHV
jgi:hypothetical protein